MNLKLKQLLPKGTTKDDIVFVCIGTDRSTGDSLGPMVGSMLKKRKYNVFGTLEDPVHAVNLKDVLATLPKGKIVIAVDACLGKLSRVGVIKAERGPLNPGEGVGKDLPPVGDYHIVGIVNVSGFMEYFVLQNTRLSVVIRLASDIVYNIDKTFEKHIQKPKSKYAVSNVIEEVAATI